jgi:hypothetical protein
MTTSNLTAAALISQIAADAEAKRAAGLECFVSSVTVCLERAEHALRSGNREALAYSLTRAASFAYGILDARHAAVVAAVQQLAG